MLTVTLDPARGTARLQHGDWGITVAQADLPAWAALYRALWTRRGRGDWGSGRTPGPWARHYDASLAALDAAVRQGSGS